MPRQLNVRNDEAYETAHRLAEHFGQTTTKVVKDALVEYAARHMPPRKRTKEEIEVFVKEISELVAEGRADRKPGATSDLSDMYDENGLPI